MEAIAGIIVYLVIGAVTGTVMGLAGVGGGTIIILSLIRFARLPRKLAKGTTLLTVAAPVSLPAAYNYWRNGFVNLKASLLVILASLLFGLAGSQLAVYQGR